MALQLEVNEDGGEHVIRAAGEVDLYSSPGLRDAILKALRAAKSGVGVDLGGVQYMDSSGVATLVEGLKAGGQQQKAFTLLSPSPAVMRVLELSRLQTVFTIRESA